MAQETTEGLSNENAFLKVPNGIISIKELCSLDYDSTAKTVTFTLTNNEIKVFKITGNDFNFSEFIDQLGYKYQVIDMELNL